METKDSIAIERIILDFYSSDDENLTNCVYDIHAYYLKNILNDGFDAEKAKIFLEDYKDYKKGITHFDKYIKNDYLRTIECPNCIEGLIVKIKSKYFCEDCHIEITEL